MIVLDSSAAITLLCGTGPGGDSLTTRVATERAIAAPYLIDAEVSRAFRRLARSGEVAVAEVPALLEDFGALRIARYPHLAFLPRVWELRDAVAAYDACYIALAEALSCPLVTCDRPLSRTHGHAAEMELFD